jgi:hypothetical protein
VRFHKLALHGKTVLWVQDCSPYWSRCEGAER